MAWHGMAWHGMTWFAMAFARHGIAWPGVCLAHMASCSLQAGWTGEDADIFSSLWGAGPLSSSCKVKGQALLVTNKCDLAAGGSSGSSSLLLPMVARDTFKSVVRTSAMTRSGLDDLETAILELAGAPELASGGLGRCSALGCHHVSRMLQCGLHGCASACCLASHRPCGWACLDRVLHAI